MASSKRASTLRNSASKAPSPAPEATSTPDWDEYWMGVAEAVSKKSKDPRCRVGAVIVIVRDNENTIASSGFNGFARHIVDDKDLLADVEEKLKWMCHAEFNAIMNAARHGTPLTETKIYVTKFPCFACCNAIIQAGIKAIYTLDKKFWDDDPLDPDHKRKQAALSQVGMRVQAPNHPVYNPKPSARNSRDSPPAVAPAKQTPTAPSRRRTTKKGTSAGASTPELFKAWPVQTPRAAPDDPSEE